MFSHAGVWVNFLEKLPVIPAKAGIHGPANRAHTIWILAFAGTTGKMDEKIEPKNPLATNTNKVLQIRMHRLARWRGIYMVQAAFALQRLFQSQYMDKKCR